MTFDFIRTFKSPRFICVFLCVCVSYVSIGENARACLCVCQWGCFSFTCWFPVSYLFYFLSSIFKTPTLLPLRNIFFFFLQFNFSHKPSAVFGLNRTFLISYIWHQFCSFQINSSFTTVKISVLINLKTLYQLSLSFLFPQLCEYFQPTDGDKAAWILFILSWNKSFCIFLKQDFSSVMLQQNDNTV